MNLKEAWKQDENQSMKGWDFSHIIKRWEEEPLPFDYKDLILKHLKKEDKILDMGTGGGEFLLSLNHAYENTFATEGYRPNLEYCWEHLSPLGVTVKGIDGSGTIPYDDNMFDIIINKHSSYDISEVRRVLKDDGIFITQQIGCLNNRELSRVFISDFKLPKEDNYLNAQEKAFIESGFEVVDSNEYFPIIKFYDVGALVFFCKKIVWEFPDFSVDKYYNKLVDLHDKCLYDGYIGSMEHRYLLICKKSDI